MKKIIFLATGLLLLLMFVFVYVNSEDFISEPEEGELIQQGEVVVAACPTFHYMLDKIEEEQKATIIRVANTAEGMGLLIDEKTDILISGRALMPEEPDYSFRVVGPGYDFIYKNEIIISEQEMMFVPFYTDLDSEKIIEDFKYISVDNIERVDDIDRYLDQGVVVTLLEGRMKGEPVHIIENNNSRVRLSRRPRMYYAPDTDKNILDEVESIINEH